MSFSNKRILITGGSGFLGRYLAQSFLNLGSFVCSTFYTNRLEPTHLNHTTLKLDLTDINSVESVLANLVFDYIIHCAGVTNVDFCNKNKNMAYILNADVAGILALKAKYNESKYVYISTDHLFDGKKSLYSESDATNPLNEYAKSKLTGEKRVLAFNENSLIIRTNFFGKSYSSKESISDWVFNALIARKQISGFTDVYYTPIAVKILCHNINELLEMNAAGIINVCGSERLSKYDFLCKFAKYFGFERTQIGKVKVAECKLDARRPLDMSLSVSKVEQKYGLRMPDIESSLESIKHDYVNNV